MLTFYLTIIIIINKTRRHCHSILTVKNKTKNYAWGHFKFARFFVRFFYSFFCFFFCFFFFFWGGGGWEGAFVMMLYVPVNNFTVMSRRFPIFLG